MGATESDIQILVIGCHVDLEMERVNETKYGYHLSCEDEPAQNILLMCGISAAPLSK